MFIVKPAKKHCLMVHIGSPGDALLTVKDALIKLILSVGDDKAGLV